MSSLAGYSGCFFFVFFLLDAGEGGGGEGRKEDRQLTADPDSLPSFSQPLQSACSLTHFPPSQSPSSQPPSSASAHRNDTLSSVDWITKENRSLFLIVEACA